MTVPKIAVMSAEDASLAGTILSSLSSVTTACYRPFRTLYFRIVG
jgi:hypothetical protein